MPKIHPPFDVGDEDSEKFGREKLGAKVASGQEARIYPQNVDLRGRFGPTAGFPGRGNDGGRAGALTAEPGRETSKGA